MPDLFRALLIAVSVMLLPCLLAVAASYAAGIDVRPVLLLCVGEVAVVTVFVRNTRRNNA